ncbi:hypothetical protein FNAPI_12069 [Fusarium napiforme]|uniref:Uncharacterized protein n=1 Tax=Fusarium napiforme TaxID=42672 RepID=A0A8H5IJ24_9HYPO|nr:hypothetical protein FNAPI_12069 [Fusarium napiforme]
MYHYPSEDPSLHVLSPTLGSDQKKGLGPEVVGLTSRPCWTLAPVAIAGRFSAPLREIVMNSITNEVATVSSVGGKRSASTIKEQATPTGG